MKKMDGKDIDELSEEAFKALKKILESKFMEDGRYDIEELFNNDIDFDDINKLAELRSTYVKQPGKFPKPYIVEDEEEKDHPVGLESYLTGVEYIKTSNGDDASNDFHELKDFAVDYNFGSIGIYWDYFFDESKYSFEYNAVNEFPAIKYEVSEFKNGFAEFLSVLNSEINPRRANQAEMNIWSEDTGYIVPDYPSLKMQFDYLSVQKEYSKIVKGFKLERDFHLTGITELSAFRDLLEKQLNRQLSKIIEYNTDVKKTLIHFYRICELTLLKLQSVNDAESKTKEPPKDWLFCLAMFKAIYNTFHYNLNEDIFIKTHCDNLITLPYLPLEAVETLSNLLVSFYFKKKPIVNVARKLSLKLKVVESLIEGVIMDGGLKNIEEIVKELTYPDLPSASKTAIKFINDPKNKSGKYKEDIIEPVMEATRDYIIKNEIQDMYGHMSSVADTFEDSKPSKKSLINYVKYYSVEANRYKKRE